MTEEELLKPETYRDRVSTVTKDGRRNWIYALKPSGKWYTYRQILAYFYLAIFFILPFVKVNGLPLLMINIPEGKFILFSKIFWPQDFFIFAIAMISFIIFVVLFTVIYGRLFCGWVCPQTVFMEFVFRPIEWLIEGSPNQQRKLDDSDFQHKAFKKILKHGIYIVLSFLIAHTFLSYILGLDEVIKIVREPLKDHLKLFIGIVIFTSLFYAVFAFVREIVCTTICPYGRLQGVMVDKDTFQVSYDYVRGEPREKYKKNEIRTAGDCINCYKCVQVCPTGIDIRDGVQMECVGCTACIDVCDDVMTTLKMDKGLIRYASENEISLGQKFRFTTRIKAYTTLLVVLVLVMVGMVASRSSIDVYVSRASGQIYQKMPDGYISNLFETKMINKTKQKHLVDLRLEGIEGKIRIVGYDTFTLEAEKINLYSFFIDIPAENLANYSTKIKVGAYVGEQKIETITTNFLGPFK